MAKNNFQHNLGDEEEFLRLQGRIKDTFDDQVTSLKSYADWQSKIGKNWKELQEMQKEIAALEKKGTEEAKKKAAELKKEYNQLVQINKQLREQGSLLKSAANILDKNFSSVLGNVLNKWFDFDEAVRKTANNMGMSTSRLKLMETTMNDALTTSLEWGGSMESVAQAQNVYSEALGRSVLLTSEALGEMQRLGVVTGIGNEAMAEMTGQMEAFGFGAESSLKLVTELASEAEAIGVNSGQVIKKFQQNLGLLNKLNFNKGVKGLQAMTKFSEKYKLDMNAVASVADKVFRPEGAIEAAAQLQVLGGSLAALGDPFQLMYKARNSPEELAKSLTKAASASATFDKTTGEWKLNAYELDRMKEASAALNIPMEELVQTAKQGAKINMFEKMLSGKGLDKDTIDKLSGLANGQGEILTVGKDGKSVMKKLEDLNKDDIKSLMEKKDLQDKANKDALSMRQEWEAVWNQVIAASFPLIQSIQDMIKSGFVDKLSNSITNIIQTVRDWKGVIGFLATTLAGFYLFMKGKQAWDFITGFFGPGKNFKQGYEMGEGFNAAVMGKQGSVSKGAKSFLKNKALGKGGTPEIPGTEKVGEVTGGADKVGKTGGVGGSLKSLAEGLTAMGTPQVLFGALNLIPTAVGMVAMVAAIPSLLFLGLVPLKMLSENLFQMALGLEMMGNPKVLAGAAILSVAALGFTLMTAGSVGLAAVAFLGVAAGVGLEGLSVGLSAFGAIAGNPMVWLGVALLAALSGVFVLFAYGVTLIAEGIATVVNSFTNMFTVISSDNIGALLLLGPALIGISFGVFALAASLVALGVAYLAGGFLGLIALGEAAEDVQTAFKGVDPQGISSTVNAINAIDMDKLNALKDLSMWMALLGGTTTIKFDESLHIDGSIELAGEGGGKSNTDWIKDPIFVSKLKQLISEQTEKDKRGGRA